MSKRKWFLITLCLLILQKKIEYKALNQYLDAEAQMFYEVDIRICNADKIVIAYPRGFNCLRIYCELQNWNHYRSWCYVTNEVSVLCYDKVHYSTDA